jgi:hypothetical protein
MTERKATAKDAAAASAVLAGNKPRRSNTRDSRDAAAAKAEADHLLKIQAEQGTEAAQAAFTDTVSGMLGGKPTRRRRPTAKTGNPQADRAARDEQAAKEQAAATGPEKRVPMSTVAEDSARDSRNKRQGKQMLARKVLEAAAAVLQDTVAVDSLAGYGLTADEAAKTVAQWLHHLNGGPDTLTDPTGPRYWPATLSKPDRSDWR